MSRPVRIFDTTLRDGEQAPGNAMTVAQKVRVARELEALGVDVIEAGFPAASDTDFRTTVEVSRAIRRAKVCAFARANRSDIACAHAAVREAERSQIQIMTTVSDIQLQSKRMMSRTEALAETRAAIRYAVDLGITDICIGPEDSTRADSEFLHQMIDVSLESGATMFVLPDTVGAALPTEFHALVGRVRSWVGEGIGIAVHAHNDLGLATANTLAGIEAGADECQVTLCGIGERAGNAPLEEVVAALYCKPTIFNRTIQIDSRRVHSACQLVIDTLGLAMSRSKPIIGTNAFATAAGIHQSGLLRDHRNYEFLPPELFGRHWEIVITRHSGRGALQGRFSSMGIEVGGDVLDRVYQWIVTADAAVSIYDDAALRSLVVEAASPGTGCNPAACEAEPEATARRAARAGNTGT